jgi:hypothetical protein
MPQLGEAISRYHKLIERDSQQAPAWAEEFQERMRQQRLTESGRLMAPVLRPHFVSRRQVESLTRVTEQLAGILDRVQSIALNSPALLSRLQMLPAEKMLAAIPSLCSRFSVLSSMDANLSNGLLSLEAVDVCKPAGLAYSNLLADLFLELPIVKEFKKGRYKLSKLGGPKYLSQALQQAWREFGGKSKPAIAIVEMGPELGSSGNEGGLLAELLNEHGAPARAVLLEDLEFSGGRLRAGDFEIDVVFRRLLTRELLTRSDLSHPLLEAYRQHAVCIVNSFRSEFAQRRALFDLLDDHQGVATTLSAADRKLIRNFVPWTRVVSARKTTHQDQEVDLPEFILRQRERLVLLPSDSGAGQRPFIGADMTATTWDRALRVALRGSYVVQEQSAPHREFFPVYQYGELRMREAEVAVHPYILNGRMQGASAVLEGCLPGGATQLAVAPVFLLEEG